MDQCLTAILPSNDLEQEHAFFERLGFRREESRDDYRMLSDGLGGSIHHEPAVEGWPMPGRNPFGLYLHRKNVDAVAATFRGETLEKGGPEDKPWGCTSSPSTDPTIRLFGWTGPRASTAIIAVDRAVCADLADPG